VSCLADQFGPALMDVRRIKSAHVRMEAELMRFCAAGWAAEWKRLQEQLETHTFPPVSCLVRSELHAKRSSAVSQTPLVPLHELDVTVDDLTLTVDSWLDHESVRRTGNDLLILDDDPL
jgi:hypothetical protein